MKPKNDKCAIKGCRGEPEVYLAKEKRWLCGKHWELHCEMVTKNIIEGERQ